MQRVFSTIIEAIYWLGIFVSPALISGVIAIIVYAYYPNKIVISILVSLTGITLGIIWAERIRKIYGCTEYIGNILATPDLWPIPKEKRKPRSGKK